MFHGPISQDVEDGLLELRRRIDTARIPSSILDASLNIATWNIRHFGSDHNGKPRSEAAIHFIAEILWQFDLIAITELRDNLRDLGRVMDILGPEWRVVFSDYNTDPAGNRERIGYLYDDRMVRFTGLAAEADPPRVRNQEGEYIPDITWWRSPYMVSFRAGSFDFILLSVHIRWGNTVRQRANAVEKLADWIDQRHNEEYVIDKDIIVMGDFNIPSRRSSVYRAAVSKGLEIPRGLLGTEHGSNLARDKRYDQILHYPSASGALTGRGGVLDFYADDWSGLFRGNEFQGMSHTNLTYELSDHLPLWLQLDTTVPSERLDFRLTRFWYG